MFCLSRLLTAISVLATFATANLRPQDFTASNGYFVTETSQGDEYVVALNAVQNGDIYFHMSAPTKNSWVGVGIGDNMAGALMLISYKSANGTGVTTSVRKGSGHNEPELLESANLEKIWNDQYAPNSNLAKPGGIMISHAVCRGCANHSSLDYTKKSQPFIFAMGPEEELKSDSLDAPLRRHSYYGKFTMDMTLATTPLDFYEGADYGRVPGPNNAGIEAIQNDMTFISNNTSPGTDEHVDHDSYPMAHAVIMGIAFFVVFPSGALLLRWLHSVTLHWVVQGFGALLVLVGFGMGVVVSLEYNRGKNFNSAHQAIGLLIMAGVAIQLGLGLAHHLIFKRTKKPTSFGKTHVILGPSTLVLALINGGLGINLAGDTSIRIPYTIAVLLLGIAFIMARAWLAIFHRVKPYSPDPDELESYRRTATFGSSNSPTSPYSNGSSISKKFDFDPGATKLTEMSAPAYEDVEVPAAYPDPRTPASVVDRHFTFGMASPVTVAPPTPRWPPGIDRTYSANSRAPLVRGYSTTSRLSRETRETEVEEESFIGQDHPQWKEIRL